jgi:hypothetical protein
MSVTQIFGSFHRSVFGNTRHQDFPYASALRKRAILLSDAK